jgi:hypothetical protein
MITIGVITQVFAGRGKFIGFIDDDINRFVQFLL